MANDVSVQFRNFISIMQQHRCWFGINRVMKRCIVLHPLMVYGLQGRWVPMMTAGSTLISGKKTVSFYLRVAGNAAVGKGNGTLRVQKKGLHNNTQRGLPSVYRNVVPW